MVMTYQEIAGGVPGESMTKPKGQLPFEKPAKTADPREGIQLIFDAITEPKSARKLVKTLESGVPIDVVVDSLATLSLAEGIVSPQALPVMAPAMTTMIEGMAKLANVPVQYTEAPDPWTEPDEDEVEKLVAKITGEMVDKIPPEEEPMEETLPVEEPLEEPMGLMAPPEGDY